jgi:general secretion pathway protein G
MKFKQGESGLRRRLWQSRGFTLVEMLLVLMILALLAGIVYPSMVNHHKAAMVTTASLQIKSFEHALEIFELDNGQFPKGSAGLQQLVQRPANLPNWKGPYVDHIPKDPWGNDYVYVSPGHHRPNGFDLMSYGEAGPGATDDGIINNWTDATAVAK